MARLGFIAFFIFFGFLWVPTEIYACGTLLNQHEQNFEQGKNKHSEIKDCCQKSESENENNDCEGKCGDPSCHCPINCSYPALPFIASYSGNKKIGTKAGFYYQETYNSSGFFCIWLPPKIS